MRGRSLFAAAVACIAMTFANAGVSPAQSWSRDGQSAGADLAHAGDFRVRVQAALLLGKTRPEGARQMLERALDDAHPAVRTAAAAALAAVGDAQAVAALDRHAKSESSGSARAQMLASVRTLQGGGASAPAAHPARARIVVQIGQMRNMTNRRGAELSNVLREAVRAQAQSLPGALVLDANDPEASRAASKMPVLLLDGQLTRLAQSQSSGAMRVEARVEFSVRRVPQQTLKGTLSGGATAIEPVRLLTASRLQEIEDQTVGGAVESAMRGADSGLQLAAK